MMEVKTLAEIMDLSIHPTIVGRGLAGVEAIVTTNIGPFVGASAYRYDSPEIGHNEMSPDYSQIQEAIKLILCKIDPRDVTSIDKALEDIPNIDPAVSLAVSLACYRAAARHKGLPLYRLLAEHSGEENMRMPLPVVSILSRARGEEGALLSTQDLNILPTSLSNVFSIIEALQCLHRSLIQAIDKEKIPLTVSDSGSIRVVMPSLDDAVKVRSDMSYYRSRQPPQFAER
jgi:enolase